MKRVRVLPPRGQLLVSTDLHGNLEDWQALKAIFESGGEDMHWIVLGDLVHGPDVETAKQQPELYGFTDESARLVDELHAVWKQHPERVHFVLGNHDAGHLGFRHTTKFHADEVEFLEARMTIDQRARMQELFSSAALVVLAPCGLVFSHGSGGDAVTSLAALEGELPPKTDERTVAIGELLWCYGQKREVTERLLERFRAQSGLDVRVVVHGHDRDESGWFTEGDNQVQPVIFGAPRANKRYLLVDLAAHYESVTSLREGHEVLRLHP
jgi:predicted phosphodiesterase